MNTHTQAADFLAKAQTIGMIAEIDQRIEERNNELRKELLAQFKRLPTEEQSGLKKLSMAVKDAQRALELAEEAQKIAERKYKEAFTQSYAASNQFHGHRERLEMDVMKLTPDFVKKAIEDIDYLVDSVRHKVRIWSVSRWTISGTVKGEESNADEIGRFLTEVGEARKSILVMMFEVTDLQKFKAEVQKICQKIQKRSFELGVDENVFNARHLKLDFSEKTADLRDKAAAARRGAIATLDV